MAKLWNLHVRDRCRARSYGIMRIDLTPDVGAFLSNWFNQHARFKFKRTERGYG